ncbi:MAG: NAD-dependent epimerase/dehydratase family protein [Mesorhizobium sp.]|nr:MAG: NAD-dependent epimerase/dehydratase family protein [Mesorhizobium sp.]
MSASLLKERAQLYMYVSSTGVFFPYLRSRIDESVKPVLVEDPSKAWSSFGVRKTLSEIEAENAFPGKTIIVRPHYIIGPDDTTYRFPYWPQRVQRGGEVLAPGRRTDHVQFVDVRDLTEWMIRMIEEAATGIYNVAGPHSPMSMAEFLAQVQESLTNSPSSPILILVFEIVEDNSLSRNAARVERFASAAREFWSFLPYHK